MTEAKIASKPMDAAAAAKRVMRTIVIEEGGVRTEKSVPLRADEVLAFRDHGTHVVVVTVDGRRFSSAAA